MPESQMITFLGDTDTKEMLDRLAEQSERSKSAYLRWLIRQEFQKNEAGGPQNGQSYGGDDVES